LTTNTVPDSDHVQWKRDFPIDAAEAGFVSRRDFVKFLLLTSGAFTVGQYWILAQALQHRNDVLPRAEIAKVDDIKINQIVDFHYPTEKDPCLLVRLSDTQFVAFDRRCTHLLCPVIAQPENQRFHCPCHEGAFEIATGNPISGPPQRPLKRIVLEIQNDTIFAVGVENRTVGRNE
jgi:Rieske Fe-S protein